MTNVFNIVFLSHEHVFVSFDCMTCVHTVILCEFNFLYCCVWLYLCLPYSILKSWKGSLILDATVKRLFDYTFSLVKFFSFITHQRSIAKRGWCSAASVCQCVSVFVHTITSEWLNVGWSNLSVRYIVQKSRPNSKVKVTRDIKRKTAELSPLTVHSMVCAIAGPYAATAWPPGGNGLRRWENQRMLSSYYFYSFNAKLASYWLVYDI